MDGWISYCFSQSDPKEASANYDAETPGLCFSNITCREARVTCYCLVFVSGWIGRMGKVILLLILFVLS